MSAPSAQITLERAISLYLFILDETVGRGLLGRG